MAAFWNAVLCSLIDINVSEVLTASIIREAVSTSEMLVSFYLTVWHNVLEDMLLNIHHYERLKPHLVKCLLSSVATFFPLIY
jgi:hypothetical protein